MLSSSSSEDETFAILYLGTLSCRAPVVPKVDESRIGEGGTITLDLNVLSDAYFSDCLSWNTASNCDRDDAATEGAETGGIGGARSFAPDEAKSGCFDACDWMCCALAWAGLTTVDGRLCHARFESAPNRRLRITAHLVVAVVTHEAGERPSGREEGVRRVPGFALVSVRLASNPSKRPVRNPAHRILLAADPLKRHQPPPQRFSSGKRIPVPELLPLAQLSTIL
ncbi:hypothetical protein BC830DRAFT_953368 [Chytriomyces sp. MP71]|nr:hypothetical protein BC830DRAFT_953368 [Chytriomyces sp. MP71]